MSRSGSTIVLHGAVTATSKSPFRSDWNQAAVSTGLCFTVMPICRHWSMSQMPNGSYGCGTARLSSVNDRFSTPASFSSRRASARAALMSRP